MLKISSLLKVLLIIFFLLVGIININSYATDINMNLQAEDTNSQANSQEDSNVIADGEQDTATDESNPITDDVGGTAAPSRSK